MSDTILVGPRQIVPVDPPIQHAEPMLVELLQASRLTRVTEARKAFNVDGNGITVAVLDTGLRTTHRDFTDRVVAQHNFTPDNGGNANDASDGQGHGTNVTGIICAGDIHIGMAPRARVIPLKVLSNTGGGDFADIVKALKWVIDHREEYGISALCMSLGDSGNYTSDAAYAADTIGAHIRTLSGHGVACCIAAGNGYFQAQSQGMSYPAILRDAISVGAVYDANEGPFAYANGGEAFETGADRITPFSQRLHEKVGAICATDIFAPGAPITSSGIDSDIGESIQQGTSQAAPVVTGILLLLQSYHKRATDRLPTLEQLRRWLSRSAVAITDGDDEKDNVLHTGLVFRRIDAFAALQTCAKEIVRDALAAAAPVAVAAE